MARKKAEAAPKAYDDPLGTVDGLPPTGPPPGTLDGLWPETAGDPWVTLEDVVHDLGDR